MCKDVPRVNFFFTLAHIILILTSNLFEVNISSIGLAYTDRNALHERCNSAIDALRRGHVGLSPRPSTGSGDMGNGLRCLFKGRKRQPSPLIKASAHKRDKLSMHLFV